MMTIMTHGQVNHIKYIRIISSHDKVRLKKNLIQTLYTNKVILLKKTTGSARLITSINVNYDFIRII